MRSKKLVSLIFTMILTIILVPTVVFAQEVNIIANTGVKIEQPDPNSVIRGKKRATKRFRDTKATKNNDDLMKSYINNRLSTKSQNIKSKRANVTAGSKLLFNNKIGYDSLLEKIKEVAAGTRTSTEFEIEPEEILGYRAFTADEWDDVESIMDNGEISYDATEAMMDQIDMDLELIYYALLADCPYELYWFDKTDGIFFEYPDVDAYYDTDLGEYVIYYTGNIVLRFAVAKGYDKEEFKIDTSKITKVNTAINNAKAIVNSAAGKTDYEKLVFYRNKICSLVEYNTACLETDELIYGDPWQIIYVFDNDPKTNVVCEGYSKAFKYLCDLTKFNKNIECIVACGDMITPTMNDRHMWNVVKMEDGKNYLVDVTNCDMGGTNAPSDRLFLVGYYEGDLYTGYVIYTKNYLMTYTYDEYDTLKIFDDTDLILSNFNYTPGENIATGTCGPNARWELSKTGVLNIMGSGKMYNYSSAKDYPWASYVSNIKTVVFDEGITNVGDYAFYKCGNITAVTLANSITEIGNNAFDSCTDLTTINNFHNNITSIGSYVFNKCTSIVTLKIPNKITQIYAGTFANCTKLKSVTIPSTVTVIYDHAFEYCTALTSITIPGNVETVGMSAFANCTALKSIRLLDGVKTINSSAFENCNKVTVIEIANSVSYIYGGAFKNCSSINHVYFDGTASEWNNRTIIITDNNYLLAAPQKHFAYIKIKVTFDSGTYGIESNRVLAKSDVLIVLEFDPGYELSSITFNDSTINYSTSWYDGKMRITFKAPADNFPADLTVNIVGAKHNLVHYEKKDPTCTEDGCQEHWTCSNCGRTYADAEGKTDITNSNFGIPALGHKYGTPTITEPATCVSTGKQVIKCERCDHEEEEIIPATGHKLTHVPKKEPTKAEEGCQEHWKCENCGLLFTDSNGTNIASLASLTIPKLTHILTHVNKLSPTCTEAGHVEHWVCKDEECGCGKHYKDQYGTQGISDADLILNPLGHNNVNKKFTPASCEKDGHEDYYECKNCHKLFKDLQGTKPIDKIPIIPKLGHKFNMEDGDVEKEPTCEEKGIMSYPCIRANCSATKNVEIPALGHDKDDAIHFEKEPATRDNDGCIEYWQCPRCNKKFKDAGMTQPVAGTELIIPAIGCAKLNEEFDVNTLRYRVTNPITNGSGTVILIGTTEDFTGAASIPSTVTYKETVYKVTRIGTKAFYGNKAITSVSIGSNITVIDSYAFAYCSNLKVVSGGKNVKTIGSRAFMHCSRLYAFTISSSTLRSLGQYTFYKDSRLKTINIRSTTKLTKSGVKKSLKSSSVKKVRVKKSKVKKYKKYFTKKNCGRKVKVKN